MRWLIQGALAITLAAVWASNPAGAQNATAPAANPPPSSQSATLELQVRALREQIDALGRELAASRELAAILQAANAARAAEIDQLKAELLAAAARPPAPPTPAPAEPPAQNRWALRIAYDAAHAFLVLHADANTVTSLAGGGGPDASLITATAVMAANAVQFRILHDRAQERVYSATLAVSLAADAPRDILAANKALIADYLRVFAPSLKDSAALIGATAQLAGQDETRRLLFLADDCKVTLWNDKTGNYTIRVESSHE